MTCDNKALHGNPAALAIQTVTYEHDANGNRTKIGTAVYTGVESVIYTVLFQ